MQTFLDALEASAQLCNMIARFLLVTLSVIMAALVFVHLGSRYLYSLPLPWLEELARYLLVWTAMMGATIALSEGKHIGVAYLMEGLSRRVQLSLMTVATLGILWFLYLLVREGSSMAILSWSHQSPALEISMFFPYGAIPLGGAMMMIHILRRLAQAIFHPDQSEGAQGSEGC